MKGIISDAALLSAFAPIEPYPSMALAVSGGPDSMALMVLMRRWLRLMRREPEPVAVLTVDHRLRAQSKDEAAFVAAQARRLGFAHEILPWTGAKPAAGIQAAARIARYRLMTAFCREHAIACLVTAHTEDDQAETFLMRLRRGSGLDGLAAIAPTSERDGLPLIRPLLGFSKARLTAYLRAHAVPFVRDPSNDDASFERVRLRHAMKAFTSAGIGRAELARTASRLRRCREALEAGTTGFLEDHFRVTRLGMGEIDTKAFRALPDEIALRTLTEVLSLVSGKAEPPRMAKREALLRELKSGKERAALGECILIVTHESLRVFREPGRLRIAPVSCHPGTTCAWDGRFELTFPADLPDGISVAPLGRRGWDLYRKSLQDRALRTAFDRLAATASPAMWQDERLVSAPALGFVNGVVVQPHSRPAEARLVPRLAHFLKPG